jgi:hypothetical protein
MNGGSIYLGCYLPFRLRASLVTFSYFYCLIFLGETLEYQSKAYVRNHGDPQRLRGDGLGGGGNNVVLRTRGDHRHGAKAL